MTDLRSLYFIFVLSTFISFSLESKSLNSDLNIYDRSKRSTELKGACYLYIGIDEPLWLLYNKDIKNITDMISRHVEYVNKIFRNNVFVNEEIFFQVKKVEIKYNVCEGECTKNRMKFLQKFSQYKYSDYCVAYLFTYRDFIEGLQGLANVGSVCKKAIWYCPNEEECTATKKELLTWKHYKSANTGFVTLLNHGERVDFAASSKTFAHELGHSFGAKHDDDEECGGKYADDGYIMSTMGGHVSRSEFSPCSLDKINIYLNKIRSGDEQNCFDSKNTNFVLSKQQKFPFCGNGVLEENEECDCGIEQETCDDPCCYPAHITRNDLYWHPTAKPCTFNNKDICIYPFYSSFVYGVVIPFIFIFIIIILISIILYKDWHKEKKLFKHITEGNVVIKKFKAKSPGKMNVRTISQEVEITNSTTNNLNSKVVDKWDSPTIAQANLKTSPALNPAELNCNSWDSASSVQLFATRKPEPINGLDEAKVMSDDVASIDNSLYPTDKFQTPRDNLSTVMVKPVPVPQPVNFDNKPHRRAPLPPINLKNSSPRYQNVLE